VGVQAPPARHGEIDRGVATGRVVLVRVDAVSIQAPPEPLPDATFAGPPAFGRRVVLVAMLMPPTLERRNRSGGGRRLTPGLR
jgi:hypothetical protein